jgi:signal transduction histidine kinase
VAEGRAPSRATATAVGAPSGRGRSARGRTLRTRITLVATLVVGITLILGAVAFVAVLRTSLLDALATSVEADASEIAARAESGADILTDADDDDGFIQVTDESGRTIASSDSLEGALVTLPSSDDAQLVTLPNDDTEYLALAQEDDGFTVIAARSTEDVVETVGTIIRLLAVAVPLVLLLLAITVWIVVGRALRPVDRMRREVDAVSATNLDRRIDESGSGDEIDRLAHTMNRMLDRLDESQRAQNRFISDASHELKSPLASLRQFAEVARDYPDRVSAIDLSDAILDEGARLERLVQNMLVLAHTDESSLSVTRRAVDLDDLILAEASRLRSSMNVVVDTSGVGAARVLGDATLLAQVVRNLVDNAARHSRGQVTLALSDNGTQVTLTVDDNGPGVPAAERERVFDRFVRLDEARARDSGGNGLGLAIVRATVGAHGGSVRMLGNTMGGARAEVLLPSASDSVV